MPRMTAVVFAALAVTLAALLSGCAGDDAPADVADVDAEDLLERSAARMEELDAFHFEVEHENGTTQIIQGIGMQRAEGDVRGRDRMRLEVEARFASTNIRTGIVVLPGEAYLQNPLTGNWQRQDDIDISGIFDPATGVTGLMRNVSGVQVVDREEVGGADSYVLETTVDAANLTGFVSQADPGNEATARVWIGVDDLLVRRIDIVGPLAEGDAEDIVRRVTLSAFDEPVAITAPD